jgi:hypothetical protein
MLRLPHFLDNRIKDGGKVDSLTRRPPLTLKNAAARVRSRVWSSGICGGQSDTEAGFLRVLRFPLPIYIPPIAPQSPSPIIWGWYNSQKWPQYKELSPTPLAIKKIPPRTFQEYSWYYFC